MKSLGERFWSKVSPEPTSGCWLWTAVVVHNGYGQFSVDGVMRYAHRLAFEEARGPVPSGLQVDHTCHNRACVNPAHMRVATCRANNVNRVGKATGKFTSTFPGVCWNSQKQRWMAQIAVGRHRHLGFFKDERDAARAYNDAVQKLEAK